MILQIALTGCSKEKIVHNYTVIKCINFGENYVESLAEYKYNNAVFHPKISITYDNDTLKSFDLYGTEGAIPYTKADLNKDSLLKLHLNLIENRIIKITDNLLFDNNSIYHIVESKHDSIFCINNDTLYIYRFWSGQF